MARSFSSFTFALVTATIILPGSGAAPALAHPATPSIPPVAFKPKQYPEVQEALKRFVQDRDMKACIKALEDAARKYPELSSGRVLMYQILSQRNQPDAARLQLEEAIKTSPGDPEAYVLRGNIALQERRVAEATTDFEKAKQSLAAYTNAQRKGGMEQQILSGIAQVAEVREDWKEAESRLRELLQLAPEDVFVLQRLAHALFWQDEAKAAYEVLKAAKAIDRENAKKNKTRETVLTPEAIVAKFYGEFEGPKSETPERWYRAALRKAPDDLPTRQEVCIWALGRGTLSFAKEQAEAALRIEAADAKLPSGERKYSGSNVGHTLLGLAAMWEKDWQGAEKNFQKALDDSPKDFAARNNLALALVEQDDPAKKQRALDCSEANLGDNEDNPTALSTLGWVHFRRNDFDKAWLFLDRAMKATGGIMDPDTATYAAHILHHRQRDWEAMGILWDILEDDAPFSMRPEAQGLYEKVKNAQRPKAAPAANSPSVAVNTMMAAAAEPTQAEADLPLTCVLARQADVFAFNSAGLFRAELCAKKWRKLSLPEQIPINGTFGEVPEDSPLILYRVAKPNAIRGDKPNADTTKSKAQKFGIYESKNNGQTWELISESDNYGQVLLLPNGTLFATRADWIDLWQKARKESNHHSDVRAIDRILMSKDHGKSWKDISGSDFGSSLFGDMYIFPDPRHDDRICVDFQWGSGWRGVAYAKDERFQWKKYMRGDSKHVTTAEFFQRQYHGTPYEYDIRTSLGNYFDYDNDYALDYWRHTCLPAFDMSLAKNRFEVEAGQAIPIPVTITYRQDLAGRMRRWKRLVAAGHSDPQPAPKSLRILDQRLGLDCWGIRLEHNGKRDQAPSYKNYKRQDREVINDKLRKHEDWQLVPVGESTPYHRTVALDKLYDFSDPGEYRVQLYYSDFDSQSVDGVEWAGHLTSPVFTVVVNPRK